MVVFEFENPNGFLKASRLVTKKYRLEFCIYGKSYAISTLDSLAELETEYWKLLKENFL